MSKRASIFDADADADAEALDVSSFHPKTEREAAAPTREEAKAIAEAASFPSRQAVKPARKREPRRYRTGRTAQFNARTTPETVAAFYAIADQQGWLMAETLERALAALQRELKGQGT